MTSLVAKPEKFTCVRCGVALVGLQAMFIGPTSGDITDFIQPDTARVPVCAGGCKVSNTKKGEQHDTTRDSHE